jgi:uncharacterized protein YueI
MAKRTVTDMTREDVKDYLLRGMYGPPELRPEEKRRYLGEFRERVVLALTQKQVRSRDIPRQVLEALDRHRDVTIVLNGEMEYGALAKYIRLANERGVPYRKVYDREHDTDVGLVLAAPEAVDVACIDVPDEPDGTDGPNKADGPGPSAGRKAARWRKKASPAGADKPPRGRRGIAARLKDAFHPVHPGD